MQDYYNGNKVGKVSLMANIPKQECYDQNYRIQQVIILSILK